MASARLRRFLEACVSLTGFAGRPFPNRPLDFNNTFVQVIVYIVLPKSHQLPPRLLICRYDLNIPFDVAFDLVIPVAFVRPGHPKMQRTAMPETRINEDDDACSHEYDVRLSWQC